ncbi:class I SAM-dependent methyltransferase [Kitasatospora sp. NPDC051170]|uniref:class I SAM-dependent methyltransferase n=1 Tax=Kitasatospora sp. NPDC051170 TaxID=3364056 RepID=UPI00379ADC70
MSVTEIDVAKQEEFAGHVVQVLNDACLGLMTSIGHQTGLFDLMAGLAPSTSEEIATAAGLNERYVREWLGGMVVAGFVAYDPEKAVYALPPEHAASLTRAAGPENLAAMMPFLAMMGEVEQELLGHFRTGGGMPYSAYPRFQELQAEESARVYDLALVDEILPLVPGLTERLRTGIDALDVGCGQGHAVIVLAKAFPRSRFTGIDISAEGIAAARASAAALGLGNASFEVADSARLTGAYDLVTAFDVIHDLAHPTPTLAAVAGALRPEGVFLMGDVAASSRLEENIEHPLAPALYTFSTFYCMTVSLGEGGEGLGTVWGEQTARRMLAAAGFRSVEVKSVEGDMLNLYYLARVDGAAGEAGRG